MDATKIVLWLREQAYDYTHCAMEHEDKVTTNFTTAASLIESLSAERDALAAMVQEWKFKAENWDAYCKSEFGEEPAREAENAS